MNWCNVQFQAVFSWTFEITGSRVGTRGPAPRGSPSPAPNFGAGTGRGEHFGRRGGAGTEFVLPGRDGAGRGQNLFSPTGTGRGGDRALIKMHGRGWICIPRKSPAESVMIWRVLRKFLLLFWPKRWDQIVLFSTFYINNDFFGKKCLLFNILVTLNWQKMQFTKVDDSANKILKTA